MANRAKAKSAKARGGKVKGKAIAKLPRQSKAKANGKRAGDNGGPGLTNDQEKAEMGRLDRLYADWQKDLKTAKQSMGEYRSAMKAAKKIGLDTEAYVDARDTDKLDHGAVITKAANVGRYLRVRGSNLVELGLFQNLEAPTIDTEPPATKGLKAGRGGFSRTSNPYTPGSEEYATYDTNWLKGQTEIATRMGERGSTVN